MTDRPWESEPDHVEFRHAGFACIIHRNDFGALCGYVGVPPGHPAHGKKCDEIGVEVHGGLTYSEPCRGSICHVPAPGEPDDVWWLGFDCAHAFDLIPQSLELYSHLPYGIPGQAYRDLAYVTEQTRHLADQLAAMGTAA